MLILKFEGQMVPKHFERFWGVLGALEWRLGACWRARGGVLEMPGGFFWASQNMFFIWDTVCDHVGNTMLGVSRGQLVHVQPHPAPWLFIIII